MKVKPSPPISTQNHEKVAVVVAAVYFGSITDIYLFFSLTVVPSSSCSSSLCDLMAWRSNESMRNILLMEVMLFRPCPECRLIFNAAEHIGEALIWDTILIINLWGMNF